MAQQQCTQVEHRGTGCVDALADAFGVSGSEDVAVALMRPGGEWGFAFDPSRSVALVAVTGGKCWLRQPDGPPIGLVAGDIVLVPATRRGHGLTNNGSGSSMIYASYEPISPARRLFAALYQLVVVRGQDHEQRGVLDETLHLLSAELKDDHPGSRTAVNRLLDVLVVTMLRAWLTAAQRDGPDCSAVAAIDDGLADALERMHTEPGRRWTSRTLASEAGMSRAVFFRRFTALMGEPPSTYLTRWRLATAARLLRETNEPMVEIARRIGYSSEFTFSRAFTRAYGSPPGRFRHEGRG
jgi:AraC-like DNA-binding protein/quercetin dioxygenase-like cupin family protein